MKAKYFLTLLFGLFTVTLFAAPPKFVEPTKKEIIAKHLQTIDVVLAQEITFDVIAFDTQPYQVKRYSKGNDFNCDAILPNLIGIDWRDNRIHYNYHEKLSGRTTIDHKDLLHKLGVLQHQLVV